MHDCSSEAESPEALLTEEYLRDKVGLLSSSASASRNRHRHAHAAHDSEVRERRAVALSDAMRASGSVPPLLVFWYALQDEKAPESKREEDGDAVGFKTFCRLCEAIIEDFETVSG